MEENKNKFERLASLIKDIWMAEVQGGSTSFGQAVNGEMYQMPVNWLAEIRDLITQLREANDF